MSERKKRQRRNLYREQNGLCFYCRQPMRLLENLGPCDLVPNNAATIEHLHPRGHPLRGSCQGLTTHVLACLKCNHAKNVEELARRRAKVPGPAKPVKGGHFVPLSCTPAGESASQ